MAISDDVDSRKTRYTLDEFVTALRDHLAARGNGRSSDPSDDCAIEVTDTGLNLCCTVDTDHGLEVECTDILTILKPE